MWDFLGRKRHKRTSDILWLDLGDLGDLVNPDGPHEQWQDHGLGLLRTILHQNGIQTDVLSTRAVTSWDELRRQLPGYRMVLMNVRSYTYPSGLKAAQIFKEVNPDGLVITGGMHATVALDEMEACRPLTNLSGAGRERHRRRRAQSRPVPPRLSRAGQPLNGRMADYRPHVMAATGQPPPEAQLQLAAGARMWLGATPCGHYSYQPCLSLAVRLLQ